MTTYNDGKYLTFTLLNEAYGFNILKIKEIISMVNITPLPQTPEFAKGVINLRDAIVPVIDLKLKFGMEKLEQNEDACIVLVEKCTSEMDNCWKVKNCNKPDCPAYENIDKECWMLSGTYCRDEIQGSFHQKIEACRKCNFYVDSYKHKKIIILGIIVDSVTEVLNIKGNHIEEPPPFGTAVDTKYIYGISKKDEKVTLLLNIERIFQNHDIKNLSQNLNEITETG